MRKQCAVCSDGFEAKRPAAKYCSDRCRKRAQRQPKPQPKPDPQMPVDPDAELWTATLVELSAAGRQASASGQAALLLARRLDSRAVETGSAVAAMVREHRAALADALRDAKVAANPLDELRARREHKRAAG